MRNNPWRQIADFIDSVYADGFFYKEPKQHINEYWYKGIWVHKMSYLYASNVVMTELTPL